MSLLRLTVPIAALVVGTALMAGSHSDLPGEVSARQSHMGLYGFNLGVLGGMAKGDIEYDADAASAAASNLHALAMLDQSAYWTEGTSTDELGDATRALPAIWGDMAGFDEDAGDLVEAAAAMEAAAGSGLDGIRANMEALGGACGGCHQDYRQRR